MTPIQIPREITREHAERRVQMTEYFKLPNTTVTIASLHLDNGFVVTGESAVVNPSNFDEQRGREIARDKAIKKLIELEGYLLAYRRFEREQGNTASFEINLAQAYQLVAHLEHCAAQGLGESARIALREGEVCVYHDEGEAVVLQADALAPMAGPSEHLVRSKAAVLLAACREADRLLHQAGIHCEQLREAIVEAGGLPAE